MTEPPEHGRYLPGLYANGQLRFAGPWTNDAGTAVVLDVTTADEADAIARNDRAGGVCVRVHPWELIPSDQYLQLRKPRQE